MNIEERRIILDRGFDRAVNTVLDAFLQEKFLITPAGAGDVHRAGSPGCRRRYAILEATIPEVEFRAEEAKPPAQPPGCHVSIFELSGSCTLVTIETPIVHSPILATLVTRASDRISRVVHALLAVGNLNAA
jgi:hypothetical protein